MSTKDSGVSTAQKRVWQAASELDEEESNADDQASEFINTLIDNVSREMDQVQTPKKTPQNSEVHRKQSDSIGEGFGSSRKSDMTNTPSQKKSFLVSSKKNSSLKKPVSDAKKSSNITSSVVTGKFDSPQKRSPKKGELRTNPAEEFRAWLINEERIIPGIIKSPIGFFINLEEKKIEIREGDEVSFSPDQKETHIQFSGIAVERQEEPQYPCDFVSNYRGRDYCIRVHPTLPVEPENCSVFDPEDVPLGRGNFAFYDMLLDGILLDSKNQTHIAVAAVDFEDPTKIGLAFRADDVKSRLVAGIRRYQFGGLDALVYKLAPLHKHEKADMFITMEQGETLPVPSPLLTGFYATVRISGRPDYSGEVKCRPGEKGISVWLPWKAQGKEKWGRPRHLTKKSTPATEMPKERPRFLVVDLDQDVVAQRKVLADLELEVRNWVINDARKKRPLIDEFQKPDSKYFEIDGLEFGMEDDEGTKIQVRVKDKESPYDGFQDPEGFIDVWNPEEIKYRLECSPYKGDKSKLRKDQDNLVFEEGKGEGFQGVPRVILDSRLVYPTIKTTSEVPGLTLVSMKLQKDDENGPRNVRAVGNLTKEKQRHPFFRQTPTKKINNLREKAARTIQYFFFYKKNRRALRKLVPKLKLARTTVESKYLSWKGFLLFWARTNPSHLKVPFETSVQEFINSTDQLRK